jgi:branched-chain amino acid transport system substrate-binding protein
MLGSDYDQGLVYYFTQAFEALGGTVVSEDFPEGSANFVSYINNAKAANAGVIFAPVSINYAQLIVEAADAQGFSGSLLGSDTWDDNKVIESATGKNVSAYVTTFYQEGGDPDFDSGIKEWINSNSDAKTNNGGDDMISAVTVMGYDAYFTALEALKAAGSTEPADVLAALPGVSYTGVSGLIEFDEIGDAIRDSAFIKTANTETGAWDFVKVQTVE